MKTETHRSSELHPTGNLVGTFLREHRQRKGWGLTHTAQKAGIVKSTLSKWENGTVTPRLPELSRVLDALEVPPSDCAGLLQRLGRGISSRHASSPSPRAGAPKMPSLSQGFPVHGDLLRAMRHRAFLPQAEAARRAQIAQGTLAKWERGEDWPDTERLHGLSFVLGASPEEVAVLTTGIPTYFPGLRNPLSERDLEAIENEIAYLRRQSYTERFAPYDLWFLSLIARLWPTSLREDVMGERAFRLWASACYVYLIWLCNNCRDDAADLSEIVLARMQSRPTVATDVQLSVMFAWVRTNLVVDSIDRPLGHRKSYLQAQALKFPVSTKAIQIIRDSSAQLETVARRQGMLTDKAYAAVQAYSLNTHLLSQFMALSADRERAIELDTRAMSFWEKNKRHIDIIQWRAKLYYTLGDTNRATELMSLIPDYSTGISEGPSGTSNLSGTTPQTGVNHFQQIMHLELLRFRVRALLDLGTANGREEGYHLLTVFNRRVETSNLPARVKDHMGPLPFQLR